MRIKYTLMLSSGKIVDDDLEQTFQLGDGEVIDGLHIFVCYLRIYKLPQRCTYSICVYLLCVIVTVFKCGY